MYYSAFYFFEEHFTKEELKRNFEFYESFTVHESSFLHVHSIQAASLKEDMAYFYLRTSRLDLDYNKEVEEAVTSLLWLEPG
jgi:maltose phosphorylase